MALNYDHTLAHLRTVISTPLARKTIKLLFVLAVPTILLIIVNYAHRLELRERLLVKAFPVAVILSVFLLECLTAEGA